MMKKKILLRFLPMFCLCLFLLFTISCEPDKNEPQMLFAVSISDGETLTEPEYSFTAFAACKGEPCTLEVSCNGEFLTGENGTYRAVLQSGENSVQITAISGNRSESRTYTVILRMEFECFSDFDTCAVTNGIAYVAAGAIFNGSPCPVTVTHNGVPLTPEPDGTWQVALSVGENKLLVIARHGDHVCRKQWTVSYDGFGMNTDLVSGDTAQEICSFRALARYGMEFCSITVTANGKILIPDGNLYTMALQTGENVIAITSSSGRFCRIDQYRVCYFDSEPVLSVSLKTNGTYLGSICNFNVTAVDALGRKLPFENISFAVDWTPDDGSEYFEPVSAIRKIWDDDTLSSFRIRFSEFPFSGHTNSPFALKVTATDGNGNSTSAVYRMTYTPVAKGECIGKVIFAMEGFSIGCGYFIEPVWIPIYEGIPFAQTLTGILTAHGLTYTYTGKIPDGFYLSAVGGLDLCGNRIADGIWERVREEYVRSIPVGSDLGEFDFGKGSGWMYSVNGIYPNYGFSDYYPQDGDAVRVQFTVLLGEDLGGGGALGGGSSGSMLDDNPDYAPVMKLLADLLANNSDRSVCNEVIAVITVWNLSQAEMDAQLQRLKSFYGGE